MALLVGNAIALVAAILMVYTGTIKYKKKILFIQSIQIGLSVISNIVLGGISGAIINSISFVRNILCYKEKLTTIIKVIISVLAITLTIKFNNHGIVGLLPLFSTVVYLWLMTTKDIIYFKLLIVYTMILWGVYDFVIQSYTSFIFDALCAITNIIAIIKISNSKNREKSEKMKNKLILFDWGNIVDCHLTGYNSYDAWNDLFKACGYDVQETIFNRLEKYRLTSITNEKDFEKVYEKIKKEFKLNATYKEFVRYYHKIFNKIEYYEDVRDYEWSLKDKCCIGVFSNLTIFDKVRIDSQLNLSKYDYVFLSFELGMKKPDIEIFNEVQKRLPFKPEDILFIDDRSDNIRTAKKVGWNTLQATGLELDKIKEKCDSFLNDK